MQSSVTGQLAARVLITRTRFRNRESDNVLTSVAQSPLLDSAQNNHARKRRLALDRAVRAAVRCCSRDEEGPCFGARQHHGH